MKNLGSDIDFESCYGCAKCTSGCPVAGRMDFKPHQAMRLLQLGRLDELVTATGPWQCVGCQTCLARCPNRVDIPLAFARICCEAIRRGEIDNAGNTPLFDDLMLGAIRRRGRVNDGMMVVRYKLRAGGLSALLKDWRMGLKMFRAGKLKLRVPGVADTESMARLFDEGTTPAEETR